MLRDLSPHVGAESENLGLDSDSKNARPLATPDVAWTVSLDSQVQANLSVGDGHQLCSSKD